MISKRRAASGVLPGFMPGARIARAHHQRWSSLVPQVLPGRSNLQEMSLTHIFKTRNIGEEEEKEKEVEGEEKEVEEEEERERERKRKKEIKKENSYFLYLIFLPHLLLFRALHLLFLPLPKIGKNLVPKKEIDNLFFFQNQDLYIQICVD